jgi:hypothetical protein
MLELNPSGRRCVGLVVANTHKAQEGALSGLVVANVTPRVMKTLKKVINK